MSFTEIKYQPVAHDPVAFLKKARKLRGFRVAYEALAIEYTVANEMLAARARGMSEIARAFGITRDALYKALRPDAQPRFDTISRVCAALVVRLVGPSKPRERLGGRCVSEKVDARHQDPET